MVKERQLPTEAARPRQTGTRTVRNLFLDEDPAKKLQTAIAELSARERAVFASADAIYLLVGRWLQGERADLWEKWRGFLKSFADWAGKAAVTELGVVTFDDMIRLAAEMLRAMLRCVARSGDDCGASWWTSFRIPTRVSWRCSNAW